MVDRQILDIHFPIESCLHPSMLSVVPSGHLVLLSPLVLDVVSETAGEVDLGVVVDVASNLGNREKTEVKSIFQDFFVAI